PQNRKVLPDNSNLPTPTSVHASSSKWPVLDWPWWVLLGGFVLLLMGLSYLGGVLDAVSQMHGYILHLQSEVHQLQSQKASIKNSSPAQLTYAVSTSLFWETLGISLAVGAGFGVFLTSFIAKRRRPVMPQNNPITPPPRTAAAPAAPPAKSPTPWLRELGGLTLWFGLAGTIGFALVRLIMAIQPAAFSAWLH
ncbi:MAG: hypothetical protein OWS74_05270, partial [Firmicutes bacterium]|nr:hypothetical protein [Bacillota bacterium]